MKGRKKGNSKKLVGFKRNFFPEILKLTAGSIKIPQDNFATLTRTYNAGWCLCATEVCLLKMEDMCSGQEVLWSRCYDFGYSIPFSSVPELLVLPVQSHEINNQSEKAVISLRVTRQTRVMTSITRF